MEQNWKHILSGPRFYAALAVCLLVAGVGGTLLLFSKDEAPSQDDVVPTMETEVSVIEPVMSLPEPEEQVPEVEILPQPEADPVPVMPEVEVDPTPVMAEAPRLVVSPLQGEVLAAFSMDTLAYSETFADWRTHDGIDIAAKPGTTVLSASSGQVLSVADDAMMGTTVVIGHSGGYETTYANLQARPNVSEGDEVSAGQIIGAVGTTAVAESAQSPHLHFSVTKDGVAVDPAEFLD